MKKNSKSVKMHKERKKQKKKPQGEKTQRNIAPCRVLIQTITTG